MLKYLKFPSQASLLSLDIIFKNYVRDKYIFSKLIVVCRCWWRSLENFLRLKHYFFVCYTPWKKRSPRNWHYEKVFVCKNQYSVADGKEKSFSRWSRIFLCVAVVVGIFFPTNYVLQLLVVSMCAAYYVKLSHEATSDFLF